MANAMTGALGIIKVKGVAIGKCKNLRFNENIQRGRVSGIGQFTATEAPAMSHSGTVSLEYYSIDFSSDGISDAIQRTGTSIQGLIDDLLLQEVGFDIVVFKKVTDFIDATTGLKKAKEQVYCTLEQCYLERQGANVSEGAVSGTNQEFAFLNLINFSA